MVNYGECLLESLPLEPRASVLVGVTNLKTILWLRVTREDVGWYSYEKDCDTSEVAASICGVLRMTSEQVGR